jgi:maltose O-acetyltransferase
MSPTRCCYAQKMGVRHDLNSALAGWVRNRLAAGALGVRPLRRWMLNQVGVKIGKKSLIGAMNYFGGTDIVIGDRCWTNRGVYFDNSGPIRIGDDVLIGPEVMFVTSSHAIGSAGRRGGTPTQASISVDSGAWLGARATILPGARIGRGTVIAAGAVVTGLCECNAVYGGVPARLLYRLAPDGSRADREDLIPDVDKNGVTRT